MNEFSTFIIFKNHFNLNSNELTFKYYQADIIIPGTKPIITYDQKTMEFLDKLSKPNNILISNYMKIISNYVDDFSKITSVLPTSNLEFCQAVLTLVLRTETQMNGYLINWYEDQTLYLVLKRIEELNN